MPGIESRNRERLGASPLGSPTAVLAAAGSMLRDAPQSCSRSGTDTHNDLSLAWTGNSFRSFHSRVNAPGLLFRILPGVFLARSAFGSIAGFGLPRFRRFHCLKPVASSTSGSNDRSPSLHSPSGLLHPSGSTQRPGWLPLSPPSGSARFPLAPHSRFYF
jgi:hypothetical protein